MPKPTQTSGEVSLKNTKQQLLTAYQALADKVNGTHANQNSDTTPTKQPQKSRTEIETTAKNIENTTKTALNELIEKISSAAKELDVTNRELEDAKRELLETHKLIATASTYETFLQLKIEDEAQWEKKIQQLREAHDEEISKISRARKRDEQEYDYELALRRKKDEDKFTIERQAKVAELEKRELAIAEKETELATLKSKAEEFEKTLATAVNQAVASAEKNLKESLEHKYALDKKDTDSEIKLKNQTIATLEASIKDKNAELLSAKSDLAASLQKITSLASSVIESTAPHQNQKEPTENPEATTTTNKN